MLHAIRSSTFNFSNLMSRTVDLVARLRYGYWLDILFARAGPDDDDCAAGENFAACWGSYEDISLGCWILQREERSHLQPCWRGNLEIVTKKGACLSVRATVMKDAGS